MGYFDSLFNAPNAQNNDPNFSEDLNHITKELQDLPEGQARYYAALSMLLGRVAYADHDFSEDEVQEISDLLIEKLSFSREDASTVSSLSKERTLVPNVENHIFVKVVKENTTPEQRIDILSMLFKVAASEDGISSAENEEIRLISQGLAISHELYIHTRSHFREHLNVLKKD
jgi:uncharacterized tellurite resistance protein B-like protein